MLSLQAAAVYKLEGFLIFDADSSGLNLVISANLGVNPRGTFALQFSNFGANAQQNQPLFISNGDFPGGDHIGTISGFINVQSAQNLRFNWYRGTANGVVTLRAGSWLRLSFAP